jgi:hypothetical protein
MAYRHMLFVVVKVETVEVDALPAYFLDYAQHLAFVYGQSLARHRLKDEVLAHLPVGRHSTPPFPNCC